jgi:hypothetical protein
MHSGSPQCGARNARVDHNSLTGKVPQPPGSLQFARLCPNLLDISPSLPATIDLAWDAATHFTPWWAENGSRCGEHSHERNLFRKSRS